MLRKVIVSTSINQPTEAIKRFDSLRDWTLIVIGDKKTPKGFKLKNGFYVSPRDQEKIDKKLSDLIGWNCIQRRNFGFLLAKSMNADIIATVDDDNIPLPNWGENLSLKEPLKVRYFSTSQSCFDPLSVTSYKNLWYRGFPIEILAKKNLNLKESVRTLKFDVQSDLWNGDPDVDAICRTSFRPFCQFSEKVTAFASNRPAPFNSQNTFVSRDVLPHYFMFPFIGRMDDIWSSFYIQSLGFKVHFNRPSVTQLRNEHRLFTDLQNEMLGYDKSLEFLIWLKKNPEMALRRYLPSRSFESFQRYRKLVDT